LDRFKPTFSGVIAGGCNPGEGTRSLSAMFSACSLRMQISFKELPELIKIKRVFEPKVSNRTVYDKTFLRYRELYKRNKKVFAALNAG
jgi:sugar (pentulose or hexulose) kinase